ncbi:hypothetical protein IQ265_26310 [Nodosilinea sp. LEGE 06152]|uniref:hypothetical protein n=1 Tax=Nodosilinea sp. LEGE 06152 TaxID=2777966 RepID=UPI00188255EC|nr:hypothetical protein [Nodosilinea sp. LEGE 06152]MBE9160305.1 hypothetical protein [Nodosilinea sp. LEGE 06152]
MVLDKSVGGKISDHMAAHSPQASIVRSGSITAYDVVKSCFDSITLFRSKEKDWAVTAKQVMSSFEAVTGQKISISSSTLRCYYYAIKASSSGKKKKKSKSKSKPNVDRMPIEVEPVGVGEEVGANKGESKAAAVMPKDSTPTPGRGRKKAANGGDSGFQVPRRPGIRPPTHWDG